jgi:hypothetical protein
LKINCCYAISDIVFNHAACPVDDEEI